MNNIDELEKSRCTGCSSCFNSCPVGAIQIEEDDEGFLTPCIDNETCIECGKCKKVCPVLTEQMDRTSNLPACYGVKCGKDTMRASTTAGISALLASEFVSMGGYVCGASFDEGFYVKHILTNNMSELNRIKRSKYVQSDLGANFNAIKVLLEQKIPVLFTGTPCQVAGLKAFLGKNYECLLTLDLICYGVPASGSWRKYLTENYNVEELKDIDFRYKGDFGFRKNHFAFTFCDGTKFLQASYDNPYGLHFSKQLGFRKACYNCEFSDLPRVGDITLGDWWGALEYAPREVDSDRGIATVLVNTSKGGNYFELLKDKFTYCQQITVEEALKNNSSLKRNRKSTPGRDEFFSLLKNNSFEDAVRKSVYPQFDAIIFGCTLNTNYGAAITYYTLYKIIKNLGYNVAISCKPYEQTDNFAVRFFKENTKLAPPKNDWNRKDYCKMTDNFILGSDQVWNYKLFKKSFNNAFFFDFVNDEKKKIAFASSFGYDYFSLFDGYKENYAFIRQLAKKIDYVSVRENSGVLICEKDLGIDAKQLLDPVFLLDENDYFQVSEKAANKPVGKFITSYFIYSSPEFNEVLTYAADYLGLPMANMITGHPEQFAKQREDSIEPVCENLTIEEWLYNIRNSDFVVTNSFHGICFSIIFRKKFLAIQKGELISRSISLLNQIGLRDRLILSAEELKQNSKILTDEIDYDEVYYSLTAKKDEALHWLKIALQGEKKVKVIKNICYDNLVDKDLLFYKTIDLNQYLSIYGKYSEDYVLAAVSTASNDLYAKNMLFNLNTNIANKLETPVNGNEDDNFIKNSTELVAVGNGKKNCRAFGLKIKDTHLDDFLNRSHEIYVITFDWETTARNGKFKIQLADTPWDSITDFIIIDSKNKSGRYANIYVSSVELKQYTKNEFQVRLDDVNGSVIIKNLRLFKSNDITDPITCTDMDKDIPDLRGFAMIYDDQYKYLSTSKSNIGTLKYQYKESNILVEYQNRDDKIGSKTICNLYVEKNGERFNYKCTKSGMYIMLYSKRTGEIADISFVGLDSSVLHLNLTI